jgi:hypothetical protein
VVGCPCIEGQRLGAFHVRIESAEPEQAGQAAGARTHGNPARSLSRTNVDEDGLRSGTEGISHRKSLQFRFNAASICPHGYRPKSFATLAEQKIGVYLARVA